MFQCWQCGHSVSDADVRRRNVRAGGLLGWSQGTGVGLAGRWDRVNLCPACAGLVDREAYYQCRLVVVAVLAGAVAFGIFALVLFLFG